MPEGTSYRRYFLLERKVLLEKTSVEVSLQTERASFIGLTVTVFGRGTIYMRKAPIVTRKEERKNRE